MTHAVRGAAAVTAALLCAGLPGVAAPALAAPPTSGTMAPRTPVAATDPEASRLTWTVAPADENGPDGRRVIDLELAPGRSATEHLAVTNYSDAPTTFAITANDGYLTERGSFDMRSSDTRPTDGGTWISVPDEVRIDPGETAVVPVRITAPRDALPGDHPAGVAASVRSSDNGVLIENRMGVRVNLSVPGEATASLAVEVLDATYEPSWNPFAPGGVTVRYRLHNDGNVTLGATTHPGARARWGGGAGTAPATDVREILPDGTTDLTATVDGVWPLGPVAVQVSADPTVAEDSARAADVALPGTVTATASVWALPIPQLIVLALLALLVLVVRDTRSRRRRRLEALLERARAEGAARALAGQPAPTS